MNYSELANMMRKKFSCYTVQQCQYAIRDCHETLKLNGDDPDYSRKLWAEIDAARERIQELTKYRY